MIKGHFKRTIRRVLVVYRPSSDRAGALARKLAAWLEKRGATVLAHPEQDLGRGRLRLKASDVATLDLVVVTGGDGTYLEANRLLKGRPVPVLGINMGSLGFLTVVRAEEAIAALEATFAGTMLLGQRDLLEVKVRSRSRVQWSALALNDIVIERGPQSQLIHLLAAANGESVSPLKADGLIVATPTGSTAYNLAAGGPILHPALDAYVVTPICAHSLTNRPMLFPSRVRLSLRLNRLSPPAMITIDGKRMGELGEHDEVLIQKSRLKHTLLRRPSDNHFALLRDKLKFGDRA